MAITVQDLVVRVRADMGSTTASLSAFRGNLLSLAAVAGVAVAGAFVKMGMDAQTQLNIVQALTGTSAAQMDYYTSMLEGMGAKMGFTLSEAAKGLYYVVSAGYSGKDALELVRLSMEHAAAAGAPLQSVTNGLTSAMNAYNANIKDATTYSDIFTLAVTYGKQTTEDFANNVSKAALMAASAHVPFMQLAAAEAALTEKGESANRAYTELSFMLSKIAVPSAKQMGDQVRAMGGHFDATKYASADLMGKLLLLGAVTGLTEDQFLKLIGGTRSARGALGLLSDGGQAYYEILGKMKAQTNATALAFAAHTKTMQYGFDTVKGAVSNAAFELVKFITPTVVPFLLSVANAITGLPALFRQFGGAIDFMKQRMDVFGPIIFGVAVAIAAALVPAFISGAVAAWAMAAGVIAATWPFLAIAAAVALVAAALVFAYNHWTGFRIVVDTVRDALGRFFGSIGGWLSQLGSFVQGAIKWFQNLGKDIGAAFSALGTTVHSWVTNIGGFFDQLGRLPGKLKALWDLGWKTIGQIVAQAINTVIGWFMTAYNHSYLFQGIVDNIRTAFTVARAFIISVWSAITGFLIGAWDRLKSLASAAFDFVKHVIETDINFARTVITTVWNAITSFIGGVFSRIGQIARTAWDAFVGLIQGAIGRASGAAHGVADAITTPIQNLIGIVTGIGKSIMDGLISGIQGMLGALGSIIATVAGKIKDGLINLLGIHSPSTVTAAMGVSLGQGLINGLLSQDVPGQVADHMSKIGRVAGTGITVGVSGGVSSATIGSASAVSLQGGGSSGGGGRQVIVNHMHVYLDGREIAENTMKHMPAIARLATGMRV